MSLTVDKLREEVLQLCRRLRHVYNTLAALGVANVPLMLELLDDIETRARASSDSTSLDKTLAELVLHYGVAEALLRYLPVVTSRGLEVDLGGFLTLQKIDPELGRVKINIVDSFTPSTPSLDELRRAARIYVVNADVLCTSKFRQFLVDKLGIDPGDITILLSVHADEQGRIVHSALVSSRYTVQQLKSRIPTSRIRKRLIREFFDWAQDYFLKTCRQDIELAIEIAREAEKIARSKLFNLLEHLSL